MIVLFHVLQVYQMFVGFMMTGFDATSLILFDKLQRKCIKEARSSDKTHFITC
jgi:hypothetical protein